ncbi:MAG: hypothetical protein ABF747_01700 [Bifidobacterium sp.]|uniref:Glycosyltransferase n=1 Tax=Bifidobacterium fermentum TaxID=3059035 RepID=A0AB39UH42_9BIFI
MSSVIFQFFPSPYVEGGAAKSNIQIADILRDSGYCVRPIIPFARHHHDVYDTLQKKGYSCMRLVMPMSVRPQTFKTNHEKLHFYFRLLIRLCFFIPNEFILFLMSIKYSQRKVLFYHGGGNLTQGFLCAALRKLPLIIHIREFIEEDQNWAYLSERLQRKYFDYASVSICISNALEKKFRTKYPTGNFCVVYNAIFNALSGSNRAVSSHKLFGKEVPEIVIVGNIAPHKGQLEAIKAIGWLHDEGQEVHLTVVGDPSHTPRNYLNEIRDTIDEKKLMLTYPWSGIKVKLKDII